MNYLWDFIIRSEQAGIDIDRITFKLASIYSPYMELSFENLNKITEEEQYEVEINPYYRHQSIYEELFLVDNVEDQDIIRALFDIIEHHLSDIERYMGMSIKEFQMIFLKQDICNGCFGVEYAEFFREFTSAEQNIIATRLLIVNETGVNIQNYTELIRLLYKNGYVYHNVRKKGELLVYLGVKKSSVEVRKITFINDLFLPLFYNCRIFYGNHFGIIDRKETMKIGKIQLY